MSSVPLTLWNKFPLADECRTLASAASFPHVFRPTFSIGLGDRRRISWVNDCEARRGSDHQLTRTFVNANKVTSVPGPTGCTGRWVVALYVLVGSRKGLVLMCSWVYFLLVGVLSTPELLYLSRCRRSIFSPPQIVLSPLRLFLFAQTCDMSHSSTS